MKRHIQARAERVRSEGRLGSGRIAIVVGGGWSGILASPEAFGYDLVLYFDVTAEFKRKTIAGSVHCVPLAEGETLTTLINGTASDDVRRALRDQHGVSVRTGLAQVPIIGAIAAQNKVDSESFRALILQQVIDPLRIIHNGSIAHVQVDGFASAAGGTGGSGVSIICQEISDALLALLGVTVEQRLHRLGSSTFIGLGDRVHSNTAACVTEDISFACSPRRHAKEDRQLLLTELPITQHHQAQRDGHASLLLQAIQSETVRQLLDAIQPNDAFGQQLGPVTMLRPGFYSGLSPEEVANHAAAKYRGDLQRLTNLPANPERVLRLEIRPLYLPSADGVSLDSLTKEVVQAGAIRPANFAERCMASPVRLESAELVAQLAGEKSECTLDALRARFATPPETLEQCAERISLLGTLSQCTAAQVDSLRKQDRKLTRVFKLQKTILALALEQIWPRSIFSQCLAAMSSKRKKILRLKRISQRIRDTKKDLEFVQASIAQMLAASAYFDREHSAEIRRIKRLNECLEPMSLAVASDQPLLNVLPLNQVFPRLLNVEVDAQSDRPSTPDVVRALAAACDTVAAEGLAAIVGAGDSRPESIARILAANDPPELAPTWAGNNSITPGVRLVVLPSVCRNLFVELTEALRTLNPDLQLHMAQSATAGVNIVTFHVQKPRQESDVFPPFLEKHREIAERHRLLHYTRTHANHKPVPAKQSN